MAKLRRKTRKIHPWTLFVFLFGFVSCGRIPTEEPRPTPQVVHIALTPALSPWQEALHLCARAHPELALLVDRTPAMHLFDRQADIYLRMGEFAQWDGRRAQLAFESISVIIHPTNPVTKLTQDDLQNIFSGSFMTWERLGGADLIVSVWIYPEGEESREIFDDTILRGRRVSTLARLAPDPEDLLEAVANDPGAIGYLPRSWITMEVKEVQLDGELRRKLKSPLLAYIKNEPEEPTLSLLTCLQGDVVQDFIHQRYPTTDP
jgi:hypothetical protein